MKKMLFSLLIALLVIAVGLYAFAPHVPAIPKHVANATELETYLNLLVASGNPPGLSVVVVKNGEVVYNNGGWKAPRVGAIAMHPDGAASRAADVDTGFAPEPDYAGIAAAAGGACALRISRPDEIEPALKVALAAVRDEQRCAVIDARLVER
jgi:hypothetical protein